MDSLASSRRLFLTGLGGVAVECCGASTTVAAKGLPSGAYAISSDGGEHLIHFRDQGNLVIKAGSSAGADKLAAGTQQVKRGTGIPIHRHPQAEEFFYVLGGRGVVMLDDTPHPVEQGGTVLIPKNTWHGFSNPDDELLLLWIVSPPGLDGFFRETCTAPGNPPKKLSREQIREIGLKYGTEFR